MSRQERGERGFVLAWCALFLVVLFAFAGFAVDIGFWFFTAGKVQKAADAAALAGAVMLPSGQPDAFDAARDLAHRNGYTDGVRTTVTPSLEPKPSQLRVTITTEVDTFFARLLGYKSLRITRTAVAEFDGPIAMGSPINGLGNEPLGGGVTAWTPNATSSPQYWLNVAGPGTPKINGDRHQAGVCAPSVSGCTGATNNDYLADGYSYVVSVGPDADLGKRLAIDIFDPAFVHVGDLCEAPTLSGAAALDPSTPSRYGQEPNNPYCTGDVRVNGIGGDGPVTSYVIRAPDDTPWVDSDNPVIDSGTVSIDNPSASGCGPKQYTPFDGNIASKLQSDPVFAAHFHRWTRICTETMPQAGDYLVQIRTNAPLGYPLTYDPSIATRGHNRFALRAAMLDGSGNPDGTGVNTFAAGRLGIYANARGSDTRFHLARLLPGSEGRTMRVEFYDTGDASQPGTIQILPPADSGLTNFQNCTFQRDGAAPVVSGDCSLHNVSSGNGYNGKTVDVDVPVPAGYNCNRNSFGGCWVIMRFSYPAGTNVNDTTTWSAEMAGDPVRLVQ